VSGEQSAFEVYPFWSNRQTRHFNNEHRANQSIKRKRFRIRWTEKSIALMALLLIQAWFSGRQHCSFAGMLDISPFQDQ
jgi:hypothetical protein